MQLGSPHTHFRRIASTNTYAKELARGGAPHGTLVTAEEQSGGRGRHGRTWFSPPGTTVLMSLILREFDELLPLRAGLAVAEVAGEDARVKWPNDVLIDGRKVAGVLVEAAPPESWAVLGIGVNVAVPITHFPAELRQTAGSLELPVQKVPVVRTQLLRTLEERLGDPTDKLIASINKRDLLAGREIVWENGRGTASGIDSSGALVVTFSDHSQTTLQAGEVHLAPLDFAERQSSTRT